MKNFGKLALLGAALAFTASSAFAIPVPVNAGTVYTSPVETFATAPGVNPTFDATVQETVFKDSANPFGANDLTFEIVVKDVSGDSLEQITLGGFTGFLTDAGAIAGVGDAPGAVTLNGSNGYDWDFSVKDGYTPVANGVSTEVLFVQTNAQNYAPGTIGAIDNTGQSANGEVAAPGAPEPNSLILLGTGLLGAAGMMFRRRLTA